MAEELLPGSTIRSLVALLAVGALLILVEGVGPLDIWLADAMFDAHANEFPWHHAWLTEHFGHGLLKTLLTGLGALPIIIVVWDGFRRGRHLPQWWRIRVRLLALCTVLIPLTVSLLKRASSSHCPWDLSRYGGHYPYYRLLESIPNWIEAGHCLPAGHASSALWLVGLAVFWLPHDVRKAALVAGTALSFGAILGWMQQMRGAHFFSHTLWSMWIASAILLAVLAVHRAWIKARAVRKARAALIV